jgi:hypothetical protein
MATAMTNGLDLRLSGSFDLLENEKIHIQLAVLVTDGVTGLPISGAVVSFNVYDPGWVKIMDGLPGEEVEESGVYLSKSEMTIKDMRLPSGIYCVSVRADFPGYPVATDMIQFHIKPPNSNDDYLHTEMPMLGEAGLGVTAMPIAGVGGLAIAFGIAGIWIGRRE